MKSVRLPPFWALLLPIHVALVLQLSTCFGSIPLVLAQDTKSQSLHEINHHSLLRQPRKLIDESDLQSRIVGGTTVTNPTKYPYYMEWEDAKCGATLIHDDIALSAAHCESQGHPFASRMFMMGVETETGLFVTVEQQVAHPLYSGELTDYDFLLLKLHHSALVDGSTGAATGAQIMNLNRNPNVPQVGDPLTAVGYGKLSSEAEGTSETLQEVEIYYISNDICLEQYGVTDFVAEYMFCSGVVNMGGRDTCQGDSGGPIVDQKTNTLVGAVSFGIGCASPDYAGVNSRISSVIDWIDDMVCELSEYPPPRCNGNGGTTTATPNSGIAENDNLPAGPGSLTVHLQYDAYPKETAWSITYLGVNNPTTSRNSGNVQANPDRHQFFFQPFHTEGIAGQAYKQHSFTDLPVGFYSIQFGVSTAYMDFQTFCAI